MVVSTFITVKGNKGQLVEEGLACLSVCFRVILPGHRSSLREVRAGTQVWHLGEIEQWMNIAFCLAQLAFLVNVGAPAQGQHREL